jgi:transcriptional regulator with XRE-family HTH domain
MSTKKDAFEMMEKKYGRLTLAKALKAWREADNVSQIQFAKKLGISVQSLCDLEKGRRIPTPVRAAKIAKKLGLPEMPMIQLSLRDSLFADGFKMNVKLEIA